MPGMSKATKQRIEDIEKTRTLLKQFLYALHKSEGFGERRLMRVLYEWSEVYAEVNDPKNNDNDEMLIIDAMLDTVVPSRYLTKAVGREPLKNRKGKEIEKE